MANWVPADTDFVDERYPVVGALHFRASRRDMRRLFGEPNSNDDPDETTMAYNLTDGEAWVHIYDHASDWPAGTPLATSITWSVHGDTEGGPDAFARWMELELLS